MVIGELRDHHLVGVEPTLHHPLALENLLLHCFEPRLHASGSLWSLNITDVQQPITHTTRKRAIDGIDTNGAPDKRCAISIY